VPGAAGVQGMPYPPPFLGKTIGINGLWKVDLCRLLTSLKLAPKWRDNRTYGLGCASGFAGQGASEQFFSIILPERGINTCKMAAGILCLDCWGCGESTGTGLD
jgi:hypothetical protein